MASWRLVGVLVLALAAASDAWAQMAPSGRLAWTTADVDGDRRADVVSVDTQWRSSSVRVETAAGALGSQRLGAGAVTDARLIARDLDADRDLDLVLADGFGTTLAVWLNSGDGRFVASPVMPGPAPQHAANLSTPGNAPTAPLVSVGARAFALAPTTPPQQASHAVAVATAPVLPAPTPRRHARFVRGPPR